MEFLEIYIQTLFDTISVFLMSIKFSDRKMRLNKNNIFWFIAFHGIIFITRLDFIEISFKTEIGLSFTNYDILPVNSLGSMLFLILSLFIINSAFLRLDNKETIFSVVITFIIWIVIRVSILGLLEVFKLNLLPIYSYLYGGLTSVFALIVYLLLPLNNLKYHLREKDIFTKLMFIYSFLLLIFLVTYSNFNINALFKNPIVVMTVILSISFINLWIIYISREKIKQEKRSEIAEQYLPIINELVLDIRIKQHEFNNKILAIWSIIETSEDFETLKENVRKYTESTRIDKNLMEILTIEHKVLAGFLYYKIKIANYKKIKINPIIKSSINNTKLEEYEIIEIIGILLDNAIEGSKPSDEIKVFVEEIDGKLEIYVSNPFKYLSNEEFIKMFELGYSTKGYNSSTRGFGLYNVKRIVERYRGKIITKNININDKNHITIGVILS